MEELLSRLPAPLLREIGDGLPRLEEIHLRLGRRSEAVIGRVSRLLAYRATAEDLRVLLEAASGYSVYAAQEYLKEGFCTTKSGCRIGLTGTVSRGENGAEAIREVSSLNLRVARALPGCAAEAARFLRERPYSTLIAGPPGCGKTTLLRDLIRLLSQDERVAVADERFELCAAYRGVPQLDCGERTDVLSGGKKAESVIQLLRTMNPQWIAVDEITCEEDLRAIGSCAYCGVRLLATAHAADRADLGRRPLYRALPEIFGNLIEMDRQGRYCCGGWGRGI